ncbi:MAG: helix-turn-helix domain-containing protein [Clostridiales bacterium]|nr:helix-turn-helix domain-containing protein [Clostridiales bacterium]
MRSNIRKLRKDKNLSQAELGKIIGVSQQIISRMERDRNRIEIDNLLSLADYFHVSTDYILAYDEGSVAGLADRSARKRDLLDEDTEQEIRALEQRVSVDQEGLFDLLVGLKRYLA